ncbi:hypothetical protein [Aestuariimicrobium ganziense]|uniref:hypothetical protein n=1 Tax=Aestuariimicrobium ganziense TaxID=2773677 RepID=UPI0019457472|nr:hypothetical protein [Aestuariimicrobium ganziense]
MAERTTGATRRRRGVITLAWLAAAVFALVSGWSVGARALGPVQVPGPTATHLVQVTVPVLAPVTVGPDWSADPASPHPAGIPEGRHEVSRLVLGEYLGIPANPGQPCRWQRLGRPDRNGDPTVHERGGDSVPTRATIREVDAWFESHGCQWKHLG